MSKVRLAAISLGIAMTFTASGTMFAQNSKTVAAAPLPSQILTAKKVFISNAGGLLDLNVVSGDRLREYNQFYAAIQAWGRFDVVAAPADADLVLQISMIYIPRQFGEQEVPFPTFRLALLDPKTNTTLWVLDEFLVDRPSLSLIREKNRDKAYDAALNKIVDDLKALTTGAAANPSK